MRLDANKRGSLNSFRMSLWRRREAVVPNISKLVRSKPLQRGSKDRAAVTALQKAMRAMGFTLEADGFFGGETETIIEALQRDHGLKVCLLYTSPSPRDS